MTIFLEIAKQYLKEALTITTEKSVQADNSIWNIFGGMVGLGRDPAISASKRGTVMRCLIDVDIIVNQTNDNKTYLALSEMLENSMQKATEESERGGFPTGLTEAGVTDAASMLKGLYKKFVSMDLTDVQNDNDPFNVFRYYAACYLAKKLVDDRKDSGLIKHLANDPRGLGGNLVTQDKERILKESMAKCIEKLQRLERVNAGKNSEDQDYHNARADIVVAELKDLRTNNIDLCEKSSVASKLPLVSFGFFSANVALPAVGPTKGSLEEAIAKALESIEQTLHKTQSSAAPASSMS